MDAKKIRLDVTALAVSFILLSILVVASMLAPAATTDTLNGIRVWICSALGFYFLLIVILCLALVLWFGFSKYGCIRLGKEKPAYSTYGWAAMIFCASMGTSILYWSAIEWVYYIQWPPFGYEALSPEALEIAVPYSFFHWGFPAWSVYAAGTVPLAYRYYVRRKEGLNLQAVCSGVLPGSTQGILSRIINIVFIIGILGGLTITYGTGIPMLANNLANAIGTSETFLAYALLIGLTTLTFATSTYIGIEKGMQNLSRMTTWFSLTLCLIFLMGSPLFSLSNTFQSLGIMADKFALMLTYLDPIRGGGFPQDWTVFYWAWWIGLAPWMWIFIAKISRGRTVRSVVGGVVVAGSVGSFLFFGTISNYGLHAHLTGAVDIVQTMADQGVSQIISELSLSLPLGKDVLALWFISGFLLLVTTMDSATYTLAEASTLGLKVGEDPSRNLRLFWAVMLAVAPLCLLYAGQSIPGGTPLGGLQAMLIITAVPVSITILFAMISAHRWFTEDFGRYTREEIIAGAEPASLITEK